MNNDVQPQVYDQYERARRLAGMGAPEIAEPPTAVATNDPVGWRIALIILAVVFTVALTFAFTAYWLTELYWFTFIVFTVSLAMLGAFAISHITGDYAAVKDSRNRNRARIKESDNQLRAFQSMVQHENLRIISEARIKLAEQQNEALRIKAMNETSDLRKDVNYLIEHRYDPQLKAPRVDQYNVNVNNMEGNKAIDDYLRTLFVDNGQRWNPERVNETGWLVNHKRPWNTTWAGEEWCDAAKKKLFDHEIIEAKGTNHRIIVSTLGEARRKVDRHS